MGLTDIFYNEINRWRDKSKSDKEKKKIVKKALQKTLTKFNFLWKDQILSGVYKRDQINSQFEIFSEEFLNLAVEVNDVLKDEEITDNLREISTAFRIASKRAIVMGGYFDNPIPKEIGEALARIEKVNKKLEE